MVHSAWAVGVDDGYKRGGMLRTRSTKHGETAMVRLRSVAVRYILYIIHLHEAFLEVLGVLCVYSVHVACALC
jgi:hypothetical protein